LDPQFEFSREVSDQSLRAEWGPAYDSKIASGRAFFDKAIATFPDQRFVQQAIVLLGNHPSALKLLAHINDVMRR
jgi:hypothetical protein